MVKREMIPGYKEQKVEGSIHATQEYVAEARKEFEECLRKVFLEIAEGSFNRETNIAEAVMERGLRCHNKYFQVMKGGTNLSPEDVAFAIIKEEELQKNFYSALEKLSGEFKRLGAHFEILSPSRCYKDPGWDTGLVHGCNIKTGNGAYLCAFPLIPATSNCYMALVQEPVAAKVVFINKDCVMLMPHDQDPEPAFCQAAEEIFGTRKDVKNCFPEAYLAELYNNFLLLDSTETFSTIELEELRRKYHVTAIVKVDSFNAFIYTGEEMLPPKSKY